ncbi:energy transducer TonB [Ancylomarina sp. YFZ004]
MRSFLLFIIFTFLFQLGYSQNDTIIYYKANHKPALGKEDAIRYITIKEKKENRFKISTYRKTEDKWIKSFNDKVASFENDSVIIIKSQFKGLSTNRFIYRVFKSLGSGFHIKDYDKKGNLLTEGLSRKLIVPHWEGQVTNYYKSGKLKSISRYKNNQVTSNEVWMNWGKLHLRNVFGTVDVMPQFKTGDEDVQRYVGSSVQYPRMAQENGITGRVIVNFIVDENGDVVYEHIRKSDDQCLDEAALTVIRNMPKWTPGLLDGKAVKVCYTIPINFRLQ